MNSPGKSGQGIFWRFIVLLAARGKFKTMAENIVILSAYHDYRTPKRASIQAIADALHRLGHRVTFLSTRFSHISKKTGDSRLFLWERANKPETVNGIECFLWKTLFHPFNARHPALNRMTALLYPLYAQWPDRYFDQAMRKADYIIIESSVAAIHLQRIRRLSPKGKIIYYATDRLDTHGAHPFVINQLHRHGHLIDHCSVRSAKIAFDFEWSNGRVFLAPFGIRAEDFSAIGPSPYKSGINAVSVGSGLFDPGFFQRVAPLFPEIDFHVIGAGTDFEAPDNVHIYPEMAFAATLPYLRHATIGLAPYRAAPESDYIADTSLKLAQFEYLGLPSVCPEFAAGGRPHRLAYELGDTDSMARAVRNALALVGKVAPRTFLSWEDVAARVLEPDRFPDVAIKLA
jgi:2-beta-glucuronyltransferase